MGTNPRRRSRWDGENDAGFTDEAKAEPSVSPHHDTEGESPLRARRRQMRQCAHVTDTNDP